MLLRMAVTANECVLYVHVPEIRQPSLLLNTFVQCNKTKCFTSGRQMQIMMTDFQWFCDPANSKVY